MKLQDKKVVPASDNNRDVNPVKDIMTSDVRQRVRLSGADAETLRQLKQNPPSPTPELIEMLQQNPRSR